MVHINGASNYCITVHIGKKPQKRKKLFPNGILNFTVSKTLRNATCYIPINRYSNYLQNIRCKQLCPHFRAVACRKIGN